MAAGVCPLALGSENDAYQRALSLQWKLSPCLRNGTVNYSAHVMHKK